MNILSCNVRISGAADGENKWSRRKALCARVIRDQKPDIICFQEMWAEQFADLKAALPGYDTHALIEDGTAGRHPLNAIFFATRAFERISAGGYWLSKTPHVPNSKSWDSNCVRMANWVRMEERRSGKEFRVVNTHLDHLGQEARERQARMVVADAAAYPADYPQILTGDMNCDTRNRAIAIFKAGGWRDTYDLCHGTDNPGPTFHKFLGPAYVRPDDTGKIDWIFIRGGIQAKAAAIVKDSENNRYPSDHYFVSATVTMG